MRRFPLSVWVVGAIALGFGLRVHALDRQSLWYDETISILYARQPLPDLLRLAAGDNHPPLSYLLLGGWLNLAGDTEFAIRFLSVLASVLAIPLLFKLGRQLLPRRLLAGAAIAAGLLAVSPLHVWYGQEARMYGLATTLAVLASMLFLAAWEDRSRRAWARYAIAGAALLYTHYYGALVLAGHTVFALGHRLRGAPPSSERRRVPGWLARQAIIAALFLPWAGVFASRVAEDATAWPGYLDWRSFAAQVARSFAVGRTLPAEDAAAPTLAALTLAAIGAPALLALRRAPGDRTAFLLAGIVVPVAAMYGIVAGRPKFDPRYLLPLLPLFQLLAATGLATLSVGEGGGEGAPPATLSVGEGGGEGTPPARSAITAARGSTDDWRLESAGDGPHPRPLPPRGSSTAAPAQMSAHELDRWRGFAQQLVGSPRAPLSLRGKGVGGFGPRLVAVVALVLGVVLLGVWQAGVVRSLAHMYGDPSVARQDFRGAMRFLESWAQPGDAVVVVGGHAAVPLLHYQTRPIDLFRLPEWTVTDLRHPLRSDDVATRLSDIAAGHRRIWLVRWQVELADPSEIVLHQVWSNGREQPLGVRFHGLDVRLFELRPGARFAALPQPQHVRQDTFGNLIELRGVDTDRTIVSAGGVIAVTLYWQARAPVPGDPIAFLHLLNGANRVYAQIDRRPGGDFNAPARWPAGDTVRDPYYLAVPPGTPPGRYTIEVGLYWPTTMRRLALPDGADRVELLAVEVVRDPAGEAAAIIPRPEAADFGPIRLLGYELERTEYAPGEELRARFWWRALKPPADDLQLQLRLVGSSGQQPAERTTPPVDGLYPTSRWSAGELVRDLVPLSLPPDVPPGQYVLHLTVADSRRRLPGEWSGHTTPIVIRPR